LPFDIRDGPSTVSDELEGAEVLIVAVSMTEVETLLEGTRAGAERTEGTMK
jgi:hypothetical protein